MNNSVLTLNVAANYSGKWDITQGVKNILKDIQKGILNIKKFKKKHFLNIYVRENYHQ